MPDLSLLDLDLRSPLSFRGLENPPIAGAPESGSIAFPGPDGGLVQAELGAGLIEGEEELFAFDEEGLVVFDPDDGPRVAEPLPAPRFYGRALREGGCAARRPAAPPGRETEAPLPHRADAARTTPVGEARELPAGRYLFLQFRPADGAELARGIEWFAREAWWEGDRGSGPYFLRRVKEDGKLATQILRKAGARR